MSNWTHAICNSCYEEITYFTAAEAPRVKGLHEECCWCGWRTDGIYIRARPMTGHEHVEGKDEE